jgi:hypothetical protein
VRRTVQWPCRPARSPSRTAASSPAPASQLAATLTALDPHAALRAVTAAVEIYRAMRAAHASRIELRSDAEAAAAAYLDEMSRG